MNINPINIFNIKNNGLAPSIPVSGKFLPCKNSNLAPLSFDTVTFSGRPKANISSSDSKKINHSDRGSLGVAQSVYDEAEYAYGHLKYVLSYIFDTKVIDNDSPDFERQVIRSLDNNKDKPVVMITSRRKSPASIAEKMGSKTIRKKHCIKDKMNDLIGARIVLSGTSPKEGDYVLDKISDAVKRGRLSITEVKVHSQEDPKLKYATKTKMNKLVSTARKYNQGKDRGNCTFIDQPRDSGYLAIHLITGDIGDGYNAEIQIIGLDVENFKEIEDLCYKCHAGKNVDKKYKAIADLFKPYKNNESFMADFLEYTKRAYAYERLKPIHNKDEYKDRLHIPKDLNIPQELDFNNIENLKRLADREEAGKQLAQHSPSDV